MCALGGLVLNGIVIGFWKPWLGAYGGEKGKTLHARKIWMLFLSKFEQLLLLRKKLRLDCLATCGTIKRAGIRRKRYTEHSYSHSRIF